MLLCKSHQPCLVWFLQHVNVQLSAVQDHSEMGFAPVGAWLQTYNHRQRMFGSEPALKSRKEVVLLKAMPAALNNLLASRAIRAKESRGGSEAHLQHRQTTHKQGIIRRDLEVVSVHGLSQVATEIPKIEVVHPVGQGILEHACEGRGDLCPVRARGQQPQHHKVFCQGIKLPVHQMQSGLNETPAGD